MTEDATEKQYAEIQVFGGCADGRWSKTLIGGRPANHISYPKPLKIETSAFEPVAEVWRQTLNYDSYTLRKVVLIADTARTTMMMPIYLWDDITPWSVTTNDGSFSHAETILRRWVERRYTDTAFEGIVGADLRKPPGDIPC